MCSYVAIGRLAEDFVEGHDENAPAYEPIRKLIAHNGRCALIGCAASSPGFTTTHLAEADLGLLSRVILPSLNTTYYESTDGQLKVFRRKDLGLCSMSFSKFYSHYVTEGILTTGLVGNAYSIAAPAREAYAVDRRILAREPQFNVCGSDYCFTCNARRWDRLHKMPGFFLRLIASRLRRQVARSHGAAASIK